MKSPQVGLLHLKFQAGLPHLPKRAVLAVAVVQQAAVTLLVQPRLPLGLTPAKLHAQVVVGKRRGGAETGVDLAADAQHRLAVFLQRGEHLLGVVAQPHRLAAGDFVALVSALGQPGHRGMRHTHPDLPPREFGVQQVDRVGHRWRAGGLAPSRHVDKGGQQQGRKQCKQTCHDGGLSRRTKKQARDRSHHARRRNVAATGRRLGPGGLKPRDPIEVAVCNAVTFVQAA